MDSKMGFALALAISLGLMSMQADAAAAAQAQDTAAPTSGTEAPKKRRLASAKKTKAAKPEAATKTAPKGKARAKKSSASPEFAPAVQEAKAPMASATEQDGGGASHVEAPAVEPPQQSAEQGRPAEGSTIVSAQSDAQAPTQVEQAATVRDVISEEERPAAPPSSRTRPWAEGVSPENQQKALKTFREGNALLKESVFAQAAIKYREALTYWDHPAIHYNMVLALLNLDRPTEVLEHINKAMAYGPDPIDAEKYEQARNYKALTEQQLARLVVRCELEGAVVSMDGQELFVAPGKYEGFVRPGPHAIVAKKPGYMNSEMSPSLRANELTELEMLLITASEVTEYRRLWPNWRPWAVVGAGVVVAGIGAALHFKGRSDISDFDAAVDKTIKWELSDSGNQVSYTPGTNLSIDLENKRTGGLRNQKIGIALYGVGGAALVTGVVLLYINRLRPYTPETSTEVNPDAPPPPVTSPEFTFLPLLTPEVQGMTATVRF
ncbi:MAG: PEGA domain-containing protein [Myxococcales bacterium]|jgi:tetratricopeptide (TPR) repeat protein|nr:PEGA domain-containing protein [Myxococcales bacterium]